MAEQESSEKLGIKIEPPRTNQVGFLYSFLVLLSFALLGLAAWLLYLEGTGEPLPQVLRALIPM